MTWDFDERKVTIEHGDPCCCQILDGAIYVAPTCRRVGNHVTKHRIAQLIHALSKGSE